MEIRNCGTTGLKLSALGVGCWSFGGGDYWGTQAQEDADEVVRRAVDLGITYFDTAEAYNQGRSESSLGRAVRGIPRDRIVIGTKVSPSNTAAEVLPRHCEASLKRLGTDYIDLYMVHWPISPRSIGHFTEEAVACPSVQEAFAALDRLQEQGKVRYIGVSNFAAPRLNEALATGSGIVANQLPYSLVARAIEYEILPLCRQLDIGVVGYMPLWQGLLSDRFDSPDALPALETPNPAIRFRQERADPPRGGRGRRGDLADGSGGAEDRPGAGPENHPGGTALGPGRSGHQLRACRSPYPGAAGGQRGCGGGAASAEVLLARSFGLGKLNESVINSFYFQQDCPLKNLIQYYLLL